MQRCRALHHVLFNGRFSRHPAARRLAATDSTAAYQALCPGNRTAESPGKLRNADLLRSIHRDAKPNSDFTVPSIAHNPEKG